MIWRCGDLEIDGAIWGSGDLVTDLVIYLVS
jgi:hypothetical protein